MTTMLVAAAGGHLEQLRALQPRFVPSDDDWCWATFDTPQSRSLLAGEDVVWAAYPPPRDISVNARNVRVAARALDRGDIDRVISTGSSIAVSFFLAARRRRIACHFIDSATRLSGPSLTGRLVRAIPGVELYTQHAAWAGRRWTHAGSVFDGFESFTHRARSVQHVVVMTGSARDFGFRRLVERTNEVLPGDAEVLWQTGSTEVADLRIEACPSLPAHELRAAIEAADVIVSHAGIGSALVALQAGHRPILVPRRAAYGEHVDDHQVQIATALDERGLAFHREADSLTFDDLIEAAAHGVRRSEDPPPFRLA